MNLEKLFQMQKELDARILAEHPEEGEDRLSKKILALLVELGELANCWRSFKYWSYNQKPKTEELGECPLCNGTGELDLGFVWDENWFECGECRGSGKVVVKNPLLEEYVDTLHIILSIGLDIAEPDIVTLRDVDGEENLINQFIEVFDRVRSLYFFEYDIFEYESLISQFVKLGEMLGFTWEEVEEYFQKNVENHARQERGY